MPKFSKISAARLEMCDHHLQVLFNSVIKYVDCSVICGYRDKKDQIKAFVSGKSTKGWPLSKHNEKPSLAVDVAPFVNGKISWDPDDCRMFAGKVMGFVCCMNMTGKIGFGADWDRDGCTKDQKLQDLCHFEVLK